MHTCVYERSVARLVASYLMVGDGTVGENDMNACSIMTKCLNQVRGRARAVCVCVCRI